MANTSSAKKAIRVSKRRRIINLRRINAYKKIRKNILDLIKERKLKEAEKELPKAYRAIDKASKQNTIHKNKGARLKSRLMMALNKAKKEAN